jgi:D-3-phosphoglycerate dehydrogenase
MKVLACDGIHEDGLALPRCGWEVVVAPEPIKDPQVLAQALADVDAVLCVRPQGAGRRDRYNAGHLKVIGRRCRRRHHRCRSRDAKGIAVMNAPDGNTLAAAEHAISLLFALARHIQRADAGMKAGEWPKAASPASSWKARSWA